MIRSPLSREALTQNEINRCNPGDTLELPAGEYELPDGLTLDRPLAVRGEPGTVFYRRGLGLNLASPGIRLADLKVTAGGGQSPNTAGITVWPSAEATLERVTVSGHDGHGVVVLPSDDERPGAKLRMADCAMVANSGAGLSMVGADGARVHGGEVSRNGSGGVHAVSCDGLSVRDVTLDSNRVAGWAQVFLEDCDGFAVQGCHLLGDEAVALEDYVHVVLMACEGGIVAGGLMRNPVLAAGSVGVTLRDCRAVVLGAFADENLAHLVKCYGDACADIVVFGRGTHLKDRLVNMPVPGPLRLPVVHGPSADSGVAGQLAYDAASRRLVFHDGDAWRGVR